MNAPETEAGVNITVRLPLELAQFVERLAKRQFNNRAGIVRMAVSSLREATEGAAGASPAEPEAALTH